MANSFVAGAYQNIHMLTTEILNNDGGWVKRMAGAFAAMTGIFQMDRAQRQPSVEKSKGYDSFRVFAPLFMKKGKKKGKSNFSYSSEWKMIRNKRFVISDQSLE